MAPSPKVINAFKAMNSLGIDQSKVKEVLKRLIILYDRNWELIEEDNYRVLLEAIFEEEDETKVSEVKDNASEGDLEEGSQVHDYHERPLKRFCSSSQDGQSPLSDPRLAITPLNKKPASLSPLTGEGSSNPPDSCGLDNSLLISKIDALNSEYAYLEEKLRQATEEGQKEREELQLQISEEKARAEKAKKEAEKALVQVAEIAKENSVLKAHKCCDEESTVDKLLESERFQKLLEVTFIKLEKDLLSKIANSILNGI